MGEFLCTSENWVTPWNGPPHHLQYHLQLKAEENVGDKVGFGGGGETSYEKATKKSTINQGKFAMH